MGPEEDHNVLANRTPLGNRSHGSRPDERPTTQWRLQACCDRRQAAPFYHRKPQPAPTLRLRPRLGPSNFQMHSIKNGLGLCALPISFGLRRNIPPRTREQLEKTQAQLEWILDINSDYDNQLVAIYADDMEKVAGVGWDARGPVQFEATLRWLSENPFMQPVKLAEWAATHRAGSERQIDTGAYAELVDEFGAGENYESWYYDPRWSLYRNYYAWSEARVRELDSRAADPALIQLAWKILLATTWQTAWHTPRTGAHGENLSDEGPSAWTRAIASHSRIAVIIAEAAHWMTNKCDLAHADLRDLDSDGEDELV